jgi:hypothetical protein
MENDVYFLYCNSGKKKSQRGKLPLNFQKYNFVCVWNLLGKAVMFAEKNFSSLYYPLVLNSWFFVEKKKKKMWKNFPSGSYSKEFACNAGGLGTIFGLGRSPREGNGNHSNILAWRMLWTEEPGGPWSWGSQRVGHDWSNLVWTEGRCTCCLFIKWLKLIWAIMHIICGEGTGNPLQYSCLENPMDGGAWWAAVCGVSKSRTRLSSFTFTFHFHALEKEMPTHSSVLAWGSLVGCLLWGHTESDMTDAT